MLSNLIQESNDADEIIPNLWLGNRRAALNEKWLNEKNIKSVFNCTKDIPFSFSVQRKYRVPIDDNLEPIEIRNLDLWSFELVMKMILEYKTGQPMLIHCAAGMQRSAASCAMFLIATMNMKPEDAILFIREKRPIAFRPSINFKNAIESFYKSYSKLSYDRLIDE